MGSIRQGCISQGEHYAGGASGSWKVRFEGAKSPSGCIALQVASGASLVETTSVRAGINYCMIVKDWITLEHNSIWTFVIGF